MNDIIERSDIESIIQPIRSITTLFVTRPTVIIVIEMINIKTITNNNIVVLCIYL